MSVGYRAVQWNRHKFRYDLILGGSVVGYLAIFFGVGIFALRGDHAVSPPILLMRGLATAALLMLHVILCIGPLARLDRRFLPLLYNRRHLGVTTFFLGALHALLATAFYHGFGDVSPPLSLLTSSMQYPSISAFPFEWLGLFALAVLFLMAATSHDFWLKNLSPGVWKALHMLVYPAWIALILHAGLGAMQSERSPVYPILLGFGVVVVAGLHLIAGWRERFRDKAGPRADDGDWVDVGSLDEIPDSRAKVVCLAGRERIAVYRYGGKVSAVGNVCAHQGGPLGEGKIIDGCITCPWHATPLPNSAGVVREVAELSAFR